jgi:hypothetical protein
VAWSAFAIVPAWLTYRLVERPARSGGAARIAPRWVAPAALVASVGAALVAHGAMRSAQRRAAQPDQRPYAAARIDRIAPECWSASVETAAHCAFGEVGSSTVVALLGDSHAQHWLAGLDVAGREHHWRIDVMVKGGCPVADMSELGGARFTRYYRECARYREAMLRRIVAMRPAAVVLASWDHYIPPDGRIEDWQVTPDMWRRGLRRTYERLAAAGIPTIALRDVPRTGFDAPACLSRRAASLPFAHECVFERRSSLVPRAIAAQDAAARALPVHIIDMNDQICTTARCPVTQHGVVMYTDDNHLTATFSRSVAPVLGERIARALTTEHR